MNEDKFQLAKTLAEIRNSFQACAESIDTYLNFIGKTYDMETHEVYSKLPWEKREGNKGPFELTSARACGNNDLFRHLQLILKQNNRRYTEKGWLHYYWLGQNDDNTIFRRQKKVSNNNE